MSRAYLPGRVRRPSMAPLMLARPNGKTDAAGRMILVPPPWEVRGGGEVATRRANRRRNRAARAARRANR